MSATAFPRSPTPDVSRPWHRFWPAHLPHGLSYPAVPAWWLLERNVSRFGDRMAVRELDHATLTEGRALTYAELGRAVRGAARGLAACGVTPGSRVGLALANGASLVVGYYASWWAGAVVVPGNPAARAGEVKQQFADAGVSIVIGVAGSAAETVAESLKLPFLDEATFQDLEASTPALPAACCPEDDTAVLLYTGGTTGLAKGAMLSHRNIVANTIQFAEWYAFAPGEEVSICALPMFHSGGMSGVMNVPLYAGATLLTFARFNAASVAKAVGRYRPTRLFGVPTMFIALINDPEARRVDYGGLRACRTNAAPLPAAVKSAFDTLVGREVLVEGYGLTETSPLTHANPIGRAKPGSIGMPIADTDARIVDLETGDEVSVGTPGELLVRGPQVMRGYWNRPEETKRTIREGWLATGDVATMDDEGYFRIVDRKKDMINTAGFKVWPREVEETLYAHPAVKVALVVGVPDQYRGEAVKAWIVVRDGDRARVTAEEIVAFCQARLSTYKVPREVEFRDELPTSGAGKLLRRALRERAEA
jgi:long-chain acyl-CoA synthetase